jgi:hypothetical protein
LDESREQKQGVADARMSRSFCAKSHEGADFSGFFHPPARFAREAAVEVGPSCVPKWGVLKRISIAGGPVPVLPRILGLLAMTLGLSLAVWLGHYSRWSDVAYNAAAAKHAEKAVSEDLAERRRLIVEEQLKESKRPKPPVENPWPLAIATTPPFPKVLVEGNQFDFGTVCVGESNSHFVRIKNVGEAPLVVASPPMMHQLPSQRWRRELQVGENADYEMKWTGHVASECFALSIPLFTNDPQRPVIRLQISGKVVDPPEVEICTIGLISIVGGAATRELVLPAEVGVLWEPVLEFTLAY